MATARKLNEYLTDVRIGIPLRPEDIEVAKEYARAHGFGNWMTAVEAIAIAAVKDRLHELSQKTGAHDGKN